MTAEAFKGVPFDNVLKCVHCGLCLDDCPTYRELGVEQDSPRGRLYLMRGLWEGELDLTPDVAAPLNRCLDCRACETACPSAVPYGELLEKARGVIAENLPQSRQRRFLEAVFFRRVLPSTGWMRLISMGGWIYRLLGLHLIFSQTALARLLPDWAVRGNAMMPRFAGRSFKLGYRKSKNKGKHKVGLFTGCIMDVADLDIHRATVKLLEASGCEVVVPKEQACCGALHVHNGEREIPRTLALRNEEAFKDESLDAVIVNAAGCGAQLREYGHLFSDSPERNDERRHDFGNRIQDILVYLSDLEGYRNLKWQAKKETVLYDAPCHLMHAQKTDTPRTLLAENPAVNLVPLEDADRCCGAAGIYNMVHGDLADDILDRKLDDIEATLALNPDAATLVTGNPGCLFQIRNGVRNRGLPLRVIHPVQLLAELME
ncbi:MAG: (Fe-S)-binding protein [Acidobacteriota bacterium]|nr:(Fe-S)-binding protein [Acidobacteriota bacterium]